jgi:hypothetical protein
MGRSLKVILPCALTLTILALPGTIRAQRATVDQNIFLDLLPGLKTAPAPAWLQPGTRITYFSAAASIAAASTKLVEDPSGKWEVTYPDGSKKHFREEDISGTGQAGAGYTVLSVVYLDRSVAVMEFRSYAMLTYGGPSTLARTAGAVGIPGAGSDFWMHPAVLAQATGLQLGGELRVFRMGYALRGKQYRVIRFQGKNSSWNYEETLGILFRSTTTAEQTVMVPPAGTSGPVTQQVGQSLIAQTTFVDMRTTHLPWASESAPDWVARVRVLRYQGSMGVHVPGSPFFPQPISATYERQDGGANWARYRQTFVQKAPPGLPPVTTQVPLVFGPAQLGGLWIAPRALAQLRNGQTLDTDPVTRVTASVGRIGPITSGRMAVTITESGPGEQIDYAYDASSGMLLSVHIFHRLLNVETQMSLVSAQ